MSQKTASPESGELNCVTLNLPSPSEEELKVSIHDPNNIKQLLNEFKGLYEQRMSCVELDATLNREDRLQKKVNFLWCYVNDLADQNQVLVQTIEDLQKEADYKASNWGLKLRTSDPILDAGQRHKGSYRTTRWLRFSILLEDTFVGRIVANFGFQ